MRKLLTFRLKCRLREKVLDAFHDVMNMREGYGDAKSMY